MKDILEEILAYKRKEVEREKAELPPEQLFALVEGRWRNAHDGTARRTALLIGSPEFIILFQRDRCFHDLFPVLSP